ncbi:hypothetical protein Y032_0656g1238 [Ancylostoma ceylanicum]|uniref:Transcription initiation factor IIB n=1 Tax=Ancylostoma ceylanicum TaxID=53326 RepID=A0A016WII6_9BILA|nr:hypothetical protein Y032_0656g1238 [Ancylostoma ceylanicum]
MKLLGSLEVAATSTFAGLSHLTGPSTAAAPVHVHLADLASKTFKDVLDSKALKGKNNEAQAAACLYIACRKEGVPRTFKGFSRLPCHRVGSTLVEVQRTSIRIATPAAATFTQHWRGNTQHSQRPPAPRECCSRGSGNRD